MVQPDRGMHEAGRALIEKYPDARDPSQGEYRCVLSRGIEHGERAKLQRPGLTEFFSISDRQPQVCVDLPRPAAGSASEGPAPLMIGNSMRSDVSPALEPAGEPFTYRPTPWPTIMRTGGVGEVHAPSASDRWGLVPSAYSGCDPVDEEVERGTRCGDRGTPRTRSVSEREETRVALRPDPGVRSSALIGQEARLPSIILSLPAASAVLAYLAMAYRKEVRTIPQSELPDGRYLRTRAC